MRLEELVEALQDRRRRVDQAVRLQLQQVENSFKREPESRQARSEVRNCPAGQLISPSPSVLGDGT